jgi:hypothetical protein
VAEPSGDILQSVHAPQWNFDGYDLHLSGPSSTRSDLKLYECHPLQHRDIPFTGFRSAQY